MDGEGNTVMRKRWIVAGAVAGVLVIGGIASATSKSKTPSATKVVVPTTTRPAPTMSSTTAPAASTTAVTPTTPTSTVPTPKADSTAVTYIAAEQSNIDTVQADVIAVFAAIKAGSIDDVAEVAQQAHDEISADKDAFAQGPDSGPYLDVFTAVNGLKNSMGAVVAYTGSPNPETLAKFTSQYQPAAEEWNEGVTELWAMALMSGAPTVPGGAS